MPPATCATNISQAGNIKSCAAMPARSERTGRLKVAAQLNRMMPPLVGSLAEDVCRSLSDAIWQRRSSARSSFAPAT